MLTFAPSIANRARNNHLPTTDRTPPTEKQAMSEQEIWFVKVCAMLDMLDGLHKVECARYAADKADAYSDHLKKMHDDFLQLLKEVPK